MLPSFFFPFMLQTDQGKFVHTFHSDIVRHSCSDIRYETPPLSCITILDSRNSCCEVTLTLALRGLCIGIVLLHQLNIDLHMSSTQNSGHLTWEKTSHWYQLTLENRLHFIFWLSLVSNDEFVH